MPYRIVALVAAAALACAPAAAQLDTRRLPAASPLGGTERMPAVQGAGCATKTAPCSSVAITPTALGAFLGGTFQAKDADLDAIAALATQWFGRSLLTQVDAVAVRSAIGAVASARTIGTTAPLTGGGDLSTDRVLGIAIASGVAAGAMSAPDKVKLDSINTGASVSSVACAGSGGITCSVTSPTTGAALAIGLGSTLPGSIGLGVTPVGWSTPALQLRSGGVWALNNSDLRLMQNAYYDGSAFRYVGSGPASMLLLYQNELQHYIASSGAAGGTVSFIQTYAVDTAGNLIPGVDAARSLGTSARRWTVGYLQRLNLSGLGTYASDSAAGSGGLAAGDVYKTSTGELRIKL